MSPRRSALRRHLLRRVLYPVATAVVAAGFLAHTVFSVVGPIRLAHELAASASRQQGRFIAEDVLRRALREPGLGRGETLQVPEGELSPWPEQRATVELRRLPGPPHVVCSLARAAGTRTFCAHYSRGVLSETFGWALGQGDPAPETGPDFLVRGRRGRLSSDSASAEVFPFAAPEAWDVEADLVVSAALLREAEEDDPHLGNFSLAPQLPLQHFREPTDLEDIELGREQVGRRVAAFRSRDGLVVRVRGHLWLGRPAQPLLVGTGGSTVVILVEGNVYVSGGLRLLGPNDGLILVAGRPDLPAFRDLDGDGRRDPDEPELASTGPKSGGRLVPREGAGLAYLGLGGSRPFMHATLLVAHDVIVGRAGAAVLGTVLAGGRLLRLGQNPGPLEISADTRQHEVTLPRRGLPLLPGTESCERITDIRVVFEGARGITRAAPVR